MNHQLQRFQATALLFVFLFSIFASGASAADRPLRLLYWNIQNGMWAGQGNDYREFVEFVDSVKPDICVWCEASSIYKTGLDKGLSESERYLPSHWNELAARYGHGYVYKGGERDSYPQVITSRYPIENVKRIIGEEPDSVVTHGAGWVRFNLNGDTINLVSLHTWPQAYAFRVPEERRAANKAAGGGNRYRRMEMEYICRHTIESVPGADRQLWMMMGDFNSRSRLDNRFLGFRADSSAFLCHDYILENTPYIDVISKKYPRSLMSTTADPRLRIDFIYCTPPLYDRIISARIIRNAYTTPVRDPKKQSNFYLPSDHLPIVVDFDLTAPDL